MTIEKIKIFLKQCYKHVHVGYNSYYVQYIQMLQKSIGYPVVLRYLILPWFLLLNLNVNMYNRSINLYLQWL